MLFQTIESLTVQKDAGAVASGKPRNVAFDEEAFVARMDGSYEVCAQIAEAFFAEGPRLIGRLREELARKDAAQLTRTAHALKGAIANFTDGTAFQSAVRLEQMGREGDLSAVTAALPRLETQVQELVEALRVFAGVGTRD